MNRGTRPNPPAAPQPVSDTSVSNAGRNEPPKRGRLMSSKRWRVLGTVLFLSETVLVVALAALLFFGPIQHEGKYVAKDRMQAVFLNVTGVQNVYFGRIRAINDNYVRMVDIYYLRVNQQVQPGQENQQNQQVSLVKLGCELHGPFDEMVINRDQVLFWENLKDDGQVAKAVAEYKKNNPQGQKCEQPQTTTPTEQPATTDQTQTNTENNSTNNNTTNNTNNSTQQR